ncbi:MAG: exopolyphosphatase, partial [Desulfobacteraceae bacterium]|nr:exopolyphosphatase [Desulfobacteraceae bacterium]
MRIVTRPDFDGIVCAVLLREALHIETNIYWVEPNEVQKKKASIRDGDILANLPHDPRCSLWFDHHVSNEPEQAFEGAHEIVPSAAGVIHSYYKASGHLDNRFDDLVFHTDIIDSADLTRDQVLHPEDYSHLLLSMTIKNRDNTDKAYWNHLVEMLRTRHIGTVMADPLVRERCDIVIQENKAYSGYLKEYTRVHGLVSITDFRGLDTIPSGNRFLIYCLFPETVASVKLRYTEPERTHVLVSIGHSIFNRNCRVNVGHLLTRYGGGGH